MAAFVGVQEGSLLPWPLLARFTQSCFCDQSQKLFLGVDMEEKLSFASAAQAILHRGRQKHKMSPLAWLQTNKQVFHACRDGQQ